MTADAWAATGVWVTAGIYLLLAAFALRQLREARRLREEQSRAYVVADIGQRSILIYLTFANIGRTEARNVHVRLDGRLVSSRGDDIVAWQDSPAFESTLPHLVPGRQLRFFFDTFPSRKEAGLPMQVAGSIEYDDVFGRRHTDPFLIDLNAYGPALEADKNIIDLVGEAEKIRKEMSKWTDGIRGLLVEQTDRERQVIREERPFHFARASAARKEDGTAAFVRYFMEVWRRRGGWYSR